jgi:hypothetical protein
LPIFSSSVSLQVVQALAEGAGRHMTDRYSTVHKLLVVGRFRLEVEVASDSRRERTQVGCYRLGKEGA